MAVAAVGRVGQLAEARVAHGDVRRDVGRGDSPTRLSTMRKPGAPVVGTAAAVTTSTRARGGASERRRPAQGHEQRRFALDLDEDALGVVAHVAGQPEVVGQAVHEGAEPHALHDPRHPDPVPDDGAGASGGRRSTSHRSAAASEDDGGLPVQAAEVVVGGAGALRRHHAGADRGLGRAGRPEDPALPRLDAALQDLAALARLGIGDPHAGYPWWRSASQSA